MGLLWFLGRRTPFCLFCKGRCSGWVAVASEKEK